MENCFTHKGVGSFSCHSSFHARCVRVYVHAWVVWVDGRRGTRLHAPAGSIQQQAFLHQKGMDDLWEYPLFVDRPWQARMVGDSGSVFKQSLCCCKDSYSTLWTTSWFSTLRVHRLMPQGLVLALSPLPSAPPLSLSPLLLPDPSFSTLSATSIPPASPPSSSSPSPLL